VHQPQVLFIENCYRKIKQNTKYPVLLFSVDRVNFKCFIFEVVEWTVYICLSSTQIHTLHTNITPKVLTKILINTLNQLENYIFFIHLLLCNIFNCFKLNKQWFKMVLNLNSCLHYKTEMKIY